MILDSEVGVAGSNISSSAGFRHKKTKLTTFSDIFSDQQNKYRSLAKEHPWVEHLTSLPKRGVGALLYVST